MGDKIRPITPESMVFLKKKIMPDFVIEAFNYLIAKNWTGNSSTVTQDEAVDEILKLSRNDELVRKMVFDNNWLEIDDIYKSEGWAVSFDKPAYNESYSAHWEFKKGRR